jgi:hypothetical protein
MPVLGAVMLLSLAACSGVGRSGGGDPFAGGSGGAGEEGRAEIRIEVRNSNFNEATIYAIRVGSRRRLGRVQGANDETFRLPWPASDRLQFEVDILGGQDCTTRLVMVSPGQTVLLTIDSVARPRADGSYGFCEVQRGR